VVSGQGHLRWSDVGGVGGDDDADDGQGLSAVSAAVLPARCGDVVRERGGDGGDGERDGGDDVVTATLAPGRLAALNTAEPLA
jgi:hypothetical protein